MMIPGRPLHAETQRHVRRMSVHDDAHIGDLDLLIRGLIRSGLWDKITSICVAGLNANDSLLDLKGYQDSTLIGSPAFVADEGFTTVSTTDIIDTNVLLDNSYENSNMLSVYQMTSTYVGTMMGANYRDAASSDWPIKLANDPVSSIIATGHMQAVNGDASIGRSGAGFVAASRNSDSSVAICADSTATSVTQSAISLLNASHSTIIVGALNTLSGPTERADDQYAHWSVGKGMTALELLAYNSHIKEYFTRRGTAV